jgi:hypothetical protein
MEVRLEHRPEDLLRARPEVDGPFVPAVLRLVRGRPVHPQLTRRVDLAGAHRACLAGPHPREELELDHRLHLG